MRGVKEAKERTPGDGLRDRTAAQKKHSRPGILGPHDFCAVTKVGKQNSFLGRLSDVAGGGPVGTHHFVTGADVGSVAAIAAYFYDLIQRQETTSLWDGGMSRVVTGGTFCVWNAFRYVDLRVEFQVPGNTKVYVVDLAAGKTYPPRRRDLEGVPSVLRASGDEPVSKEDDGDFDPCRDARPPVPDL